MGLLHLLFGFHGRLNRVGYWLGISAILVFLAAAYVLIGRLNVGVEGESAGVFSTPLGGLLFVIAAGGGLWSFLAVHVKRWHDRGKGWLWVILTLVPVVGPVWTLVECGFLTGAPRPNPFDR